MRRCYMIDYPIMVITRLVATHFRRFERLELELRPGFNLLIGDNGSGKTAILDALMLGLGCYFLGFRSKLQPAPGLSSDDAQQVLIGQNMEEQYPVKLRWTGVLASQEIQWFRERKNDTSKTTVKYARPLIALGEALQRQMRMKDQNVDLPVFAYYGTERLWLQLRTHRTALQRVGTRAAGYRYCLARESNVRYIAEWMLQRTLVEVQEFAQHRQGGVGPTPAPDVHLAGIERAVCACVDQARRFYFSVKHKELFLEFDDGRRLPFHLLSDGVRGMVLLAADLAWRSVALNPHQGADAPRLARGVVLIDEVDLALHPRWQIRVVDDLRRAFPNLQFVATTHAPLVLAGAKDANVIQLADDRAYAGRPVYGKDSNTVLTDIMGGQSRPLAVTQELEHVSALIDEDRVNEARLAIERLEDVLGPDDTELVRLRTALRFLYPPRSAA